MICQRSALRLKTADSSHVRGAAPDASWRRHLESLLPVKASCLDMGLARLPDPEARFALGGDEPLYFSVHSAAAKLAREGVAVVHAMKYLGPEPASASDEAQPERLDRHQALRRVAAR